MNGHLILNTLAVTAVSLGSLFSCHSPTLEERYQEGATSYTEQKMEQAFSIFNELASEEYAPAMQQVGLMLIRGEGHQKEVSAGINWIQRCSNNVLSAETCMLVGQRFYEGGEIDEDVGRAMIWTKRAADKGDESAEMRVAIMMLDNPEKIPSKLKTLQLMRNAADEGSADAQNRLGEVYERVEDFDKEKSVSYYLQAAKAGNEKAKAGLIRVMLSEQPWLRTLRQTKYPEALDYIDSIDSVRDAHCSFLLGQDWLEGTRVQHVEKALKLLRYAANHDDAQAQYVLGTLYEHGEHIKRSKDEAVQWYTRSAKQGNHHAQARLALAIAQDGRTDVPEGKSDYWLEKALASYDWEAFMVAGEIFDMENKKENPGDDQSFSKPIKLRMNTGKLYETAGRTDAKTGKFIFARPVEGTNSLLLRKLDFPSRLLVDPAFRRAYAEVLAIEKTAQRASASDGEATPLLALDDSNVAEMDKLDWRLVAELAASGDDDALYTLGMMHYYGVPHAANRNKARECWKEASRSGHSLAGYALACSYIGINKSEAIKYLRTAADQGCLRASYLMGIIYQEGLFGQKRNLLLAERYLEGPVNHGYSRDATVRLAHIFYEGGDTEGRLATCKTHAKDAATDPDGTLAYILARYHKDKKSYIEARRWLERSAKAPIPNPAANCDMGILAERTDPAMAFLYYRKSSALGDPRGCYRLGRLYLRRNSPVANDELGVRFLNTSSAQGHSDAKKYLKKYLKRKKNIKQYLQQLAAMQEEERARHARRLEKLRSHYSYHLLYSKDNLGKTKSGGAATM